MKIYTYVVNNEINIHYNGIYLKLINNYSRVKTQNVTILDWHAMIKTDISLNPCLSEPSKAYN